MIGPLVAFGVRVVIPALGGVVCVVAGITAIRRRGPAVGAYADLAIPFGVLSVLFGAYGLLYAVAMAFETTGVQLIGSVADRAMGILVRIIILPWTVFALR